MTAEFVIEDVPASPAKFNFDILAQTLLDVVIRPRQGAFVLGIHGSWGSGKTTLMNAMQTLLYQQSDVVIVEFNAWKYHQREALWRALIIQVLEALKKDNVGGSEIVEMERSLYASFTAHEQGSLQFNWSAAVTEALLLSIRLGTANLAGGVIDRIGDFLNMIFNRKSTADDAKTEDVAKSVERVSSIFSRKIIERSVEQVISIEQFLSRFRRLVRELSGGKRIYVIVDDLDRCLPESALEVFEAIKLFLDAPECTYIVALDRDVIRRGLALRYISGSDIVNTDEYIEKTITLSFDLPPLALTDGRAMFRSCVSGIELDDAQVDAIVEALGTNPRRLKRFARLLSVLLGMQQTLAARSPLSPGSSDDQSLFIKIALLGYQNSGVFNLMLREPALGYRLQNAANALSHVRRNRGDHYAVEELRKALEKEHQLVQTAAFDPGLWRILNLQPMIEQNPDKLIAAMHWFGSAVPIRQAAKSARL